MCTICVSKTLLQISENICVYACEDSLHVCLFVLFSSVQWARQPLFILLISELVCVQMHAQAYECQTEW